jgi:hypothetical protein
MLVKKKMLLELEAGMILAKNITNFKFAYALKKNYNFFKDELEALKEANKPSAEYEKYIAALPKNIKCPQCGFIAAGVNQRIDAEFKDAIATRETQQKAFDEELLKEIDISFYQIEEGVLEPIKDQLTFAMLNALEPILKIDYSK